MTRLPLVPGARLVRALERVGFALVRQRGSHIFLRHPDGRTTVVPVHKGEDLGRGILRKILRDAELTPEEFVELL